MKISGDNRILSHFFKDEKSPVYTIIYPPQHTLAERVAYLDELLLEMKTALKQENELKAEHAEYMKNGGKEDFESWLKNKFEAEKKTKEEKETKVEEVKDIPNVEIIEEAKVE